ncbi:MAG: hypothetical protein IIB38_13315 [Candidatus Hydrogenedentes bacterium]|nr:hypothetical protein [Candidatus Hydrogenedentota bacterium]
MLDQKMWRTWGAIAVLGAGGMAWYAVTADILRDTVAHLATRSMEEVTEVATQTSLTFCLAYWFVFMLLILASFYAAFLDIRYLRLQYAVGKRELLRDTLDDEEFRKALLNAMDDE